MTRLLEESFKTDSVKFYALLVFTIFIVYYTPDVVSQVIFIVFLILFFNSKKDFFWIAFIFILYVEPNGLFSGRLFAEFQRIPVYSFGKKFTFAFFELFFIAMFLKVLMKSRKKKLVLSGPLQVLLGFFVFSYLYSMVLGMSASSHIQTLRTWAPFVLFFCMPTLMDDEQDYFRFMYLLFPIMLFVLAGQIFEIIFNVKLARLLVGNVSLIANLSDIPEYEGLIRVINASYLSFFCLLFALVVLNIKNKKYNKLYISVVLAAAIFSIYLSATRGWIIAFATLTNVFAKYAFLYEKQSSKRT